MNHAQTSVGPQRATFDGLQVRYERRGSLGGQKADLPVLVLHGWGADLAAVEPIVGELASATEVVALDLPGFGESEPPGEPWDADRYAEFVVGFLDALGLGRVHLVGHSNGGRVAICIATARPERVGRLLLCDAAGLRPRRPLRYYVRVAIAKLGRLLGLFGARGARLQDAVRGRLGSADYLSATPAMRETFKLLIASDLESRLGSIKATTLLVWGENDDDTPLWMGERLERGIEGAGLVVFEGAGHFAYADDRARFGAVARLFLCEQPRSVG